MLRIMKNEEFSALLESWELVSLKDADEAVALERDGQVLALGCLYWKDEDTIHMRVAHKTEEDNAAFINEFIPYAREKYPGKVLLYTIVDYEPQMMEVVRSHGFEVADIRHCWMGDPESNYVEDDEEKNPHVHLYQDEDVMFFTYREREMVEAVLTCDLEYVGYELGAANARSVCFRNEFDGEIYSELFRALIRELGGQACPDLFVDDVPPEGESILKELGINAWLEMIDCSIQL